MQMKGKDFWLVELGVGTGPLVLGTEFETLLDVLRENSIDGARLTLDRSGKVPLPEFRTHLFFSQARPQTLTRIDVADERLRFGSLSVIGKRAHEIVGLFKVSRKVLGPIAFRDVGFEAAFPFGIGILAIYSILRLAVFGRSQFWRRRSGS